MSTRQQQHQYLEGDSRYPCEEVEPHPPHQTGGSYPLRGGTYGRGAEFCPGIQGPGWRRLRFRRGDPSTSDSIQWVVLR